MLYNLVAHGRCILGYKGHHKLDAEIKKNKGKSINIKGGQFLSIWGYAPFSF